MADMRHNTATSVTIQCEHTAPIVYNRFPRHVMWLGVVQVVCGCVLFIVRVISFATGLFFGFIGAALIVPAIVTGSFGIAAGRNKYICQITTSMILSILTVIGSCSVVINTAGIVVATGLFGHDYMHRQQLAELLVTLIIALIEIVTSIVISAIACHFSCFCCKNCCCNYDTTTTEQIVMKSAQREQQVLFLGATAHGAQMPESIATINYEAERRVNPPPHYSKGDM